VTPPGKAINMINQWGAQPSEGVRAGRVFAFKTLPTASATIKGFEVMRMIRKRQCLMLESGAAGEVRFVNRLFRLAA